MELDNLMPPLPSDTLALVRILSEWADSMPFEKVYVFGSRVRGDHRNDSDIDIALILKKKGITEAEAKAWSKANENDFADLKARLGVPISLHMQENEGVEWTEITQAMQRPLYEVGCVACLWTQPKHT